MRFAPSTPMKRVTIFGMFSIVTGMLVVPSLRKRRRWVRRLVIRRQLLDLLQRVGDVLRRQPQEVLLAGDHRGCIRAGGQAFLLDDRELAVGRGLTTTTTELLLDGLEDLISTAQHARDIGAHHERVLPRRV